MLRIFMSCVSDEFASYREPLRKKLARPDIVVNIQEDFTDGLRPTLSKLDDYIKDCDLVIHLVGNMTGVRPAPASIDDIKRKYGPSLTEKLPFLTDALAHSEVPISLTQWEAYLAAFHCKDLLIAIAAPGAERKNDTYISDPAQRESQQVHLNRLESLDRYRTRTPFTTIDGLAVDIYHAALPIFANAAKSKPISLGGVQALRWFKGRDADLEKLHNSLQGGAIHNFAVTSHVLCGQGGIGKTQLAVEYARRHKEEYTALLFAVADSPADLSRNLAALADAKALNLPERTLSQQEASAAVVNWLGSNSGWLLILDNADSEEAAAAVETLLADLGKGGHVLITSRRRNWSAAKTQELGVIDTSAAVAFLLERTEGDGGRQKTRDDSEQALQLAKELGNFTLALSQCGAFICWHHVTFAEYRTKLATSRDKVMRWNNAQLMNKYARGVATTWLTSFDRLSQPAKDLLYRLAWLSIEPIPKAVLHIKASTDAADDQDDALAELDQCSLVTRAKDGPSFTLHGLLQDVMRRSLSREDAVGMLGQAAKWIALALEQADEAELRADLVPHAISVLYFLRDDDYRDIAASELFDPLSQRVIYTLLQAGSRSISPQYLARLLGDYYEVEPLEGALANLYQEHPELWAEIEKLLLAENNYVLRYAMGRTLAEAYKTDSALMPRIVSLLGSSDMNEFEYAAYALTGIYEDYPELLLKPHHLEKLAEYDAYPGPFAVSNMLIGLVADPGSNSPPLPAPRELVSSRKLWNSHWEFIKLDVWELDAAVDFLARRPLAAPVPEVAECYDNLQKIDDKIGTFLKDGHVGELTRVLFAPTNYRSLAHDTSKIRGAQDELAANPRLHDLMWLLFAHPCWSVGEAAAAVLASLVNADRRNLHLVSELLKDKNWRVQLAANEAAFQLRNLAPDLFYGAVHRFHGNHPEEARFNCKIRGLCAENLVSVILSPGASRKGLLHQFEREIRYWLRDEDCWVLEHVYRLFATLHKRRVDLGWLLSDGVSRLFDDYPDWYKSSRAEFLRHIERRKIALRQAPQLVPTDYSAQQRNRCPG